MFGRIFSSFASVWWNIRSQTPFCSVRFLVEITRIQQMCHENSFGPALNSKCFHSQRGRTKSVAVIHPDLLTEPCMCGCDGSWVHPCRSRQQRWLWKDFKPNHARITTHHHLPRLSDTQIDIVVHVCKTLWWCVYAHSKSMGMWHGDWTNNRKTRRNKQLCCFLSTIWIFESIFNICVLSVDDC